jgi:hypothetical protein
VINQITTETINGRREYRVPFILNGETTLTEVEVLAVKESKIVTTKILKQIRDLLVLQFTEEVIKEKE